jgi:uncharacterized protein YqgQ
MAEYELLQKTLKILRSNNTIDKEEYVKLRYIPADGIDPLCSAVNGTN